MICELVKSDTKISGAKHFARIFANLDDATRATFLTGVINTLGDPVTHKLHYCEASVLLKALIIRLLQESNCAFIAGRLVKQ